MFGANGKFITELTGEATLSKWGKERVEMDPLMSSGRDIAQGLEEQEGPFQGPIAVEVGDDGAVYVVEVARHRVQVFYKQSATFSGGPL